MGLLSIKNKKVTFLEKFKIPGIILVCLIFGVELGSILARIYAGDRASIISSSLYAVISLLTAIMVFGTFARVIQLVRKISPSSKARKPLLKISYLLVGAAIISVLVFVMTLLYATPIPTQAVGSFL